MGYVSQTAPASSSRTGYISQTAQSPGAVDEGHSVLGFLGNLVGGVKDVTLGLGKLIVAPAADLARGAIEGITLGKADLPGGYMTDDVIKGLAAMPQDYWDRYSPLLPGGRPASEFLQELYDKPVSFGLDALAAASIAGKAAGVGVASKVEAAGGEIAATAEGVSDALINMGKVSPRTAKLTGLREASKLMEAPPSYAKLLPELKWTRSGLDLTQMTTLRNPLLRATRTLAETKLGSHSFQIPISAFDEVVQVGGKAIPKLILDNASGFDATAEGISSYVAREMGILERAKAVGMTYIDRPSTYNFRARSTVGVIQRMHSGSWFADRAKEQAAIKGIAKPHLDRMGEGELAASVLRSMDANLLINGMVDLTDDLTVRVIRENGGFVGESEHGFAKVIDIPDEPVPLKTEHLPEVAEKLKELQPEYHPDQAVEVLQNSKESINGPNVYGRDIAAELDGVDREIDNIIREAEAVASGIADEQLLMDAKFHAKDILDHESDFKAMIRTPLDMLEEANRAAREVNGMGMGEHAIKGLGLRQILLAKKLLGRHTVEMGRVYEQLIDDLPDNFDLRSAKGKIRALRKTFGDDKVVELAQYIDNIDKLSAGDVAKLINTHRPQGGLLPDVVLPSTEVIAVGKDAEATVKKTPVVTSKKGTIASLREEVNGVLGDELAAQVMEGVDSLATLRERLRTLELNPGSLADDSHLVFDDAVRAAGEMSPTYMPMVDAARVKGGDWLQRTPGTEAALRAAKDPHEKYNAQVLFRENRYVKDPLDARLRRAARHSKADGTLRYIEGVVNSGVGRKLQPGEILAPDEVAIPIQFNRFKNRLTKNFYDARLKHMAAGMSDADATLRATIDVMDDIHERVKRGELDSGSEQIYAVPKAVGDQLSSVARSAGIMNGPIAKVYLQGPMNVWRSLVLAGSPRWIVNNVLGNAVFSIMQGAPVLRAFHILEQRYARILNERYGWHLKTGMIDELEAHLDEAGLLEDAVTTYAGVEREMKTVIPGAENVPGPGGKILTKSRTNPGRVLSRAQKIGGGVRTLNAEIETAFRMNSALTSAERLAGITRMKKMMSGFGKTQERMNAVFRDGLTEAKARTIVKDMNYFFGDFQDMGAWERNIVRPYIFPFWGFYKHVGKLLLSYPFEFPERAVVLGGIANATQDMMEAYGPMPTWMEGAFPLAPPGSGDQPFLMTSGPNPFSGLFQTPLAGLSPLLKIPIEHFTGRSLFTGQQFSDKDVVTPFGTEQQFKIVRDASGKPIDVVPIDKVTPSPWEAILGQIPQYEQLKDLIAGGKTSDTSGIVDAIKSRLGRGGGLITDPETGEAKYPVSLASSVAKFGGFSTLPYDYRAYQENLEEQARAALTEALRGGY